MQPIPPNPPLGATAPADRFHEFGFPWDHTAWTADFAFALMRAEDIPDSADQAATDVEKMRALQSLTWSIAQSAVGDFGSDLARVRGGGGRDQHHRPPPPFSDQAPPPQHNPHHPPPPPRTR